MSWLTGLTGRAEEILNRLDQSAAAALTNNEDDFPTGSTKEGHQGNQSISKTVPLSLSDQDVDQSSSFVSKPIKQSSFTSKKSPATQRRASDGIPTTPTHVTSTPAKKGLDTDEALFNFLNSSEPADSSKKRTTPKHSRQSSTSSIVSNKNGSYKNVEPAPSLSGSSIVHIDSVGTGSERESPNSIPDGTADVAMIAEAMLDQSPSNSVHSNQETESPDNTQQKMSSLELENKLLKNEIASLNHEMSSLIQRSKMAQQELQNTQHKLHEYNKSASMNDQLVRELQSRESDLMEALAAKDSQLAVLRVRLEEADTEILRKSESVQNLEHERCRILQDHTDSTGMHSQALDSLKARLLEVESALHREQEAYKNAQKEASERQSRLEDEQRSLAEALTAAERKANEEKGKANEMQSQIRIAKSNLEAAKQELAEYKDKATRILQSKERLIASLREGPGAAGESAGVSSLEYDSVKQERDMFKEELLQSRMSIENLRADLQDLEGQMQQEGDAAAEQIKALEDGVMTEKHRREDTEQELLKQKQELQYAIEEMHRNKSAYQSKIQERELEIDKLRGQLMAKSVSSSSESELESRIRALTESLIQKQTMLEALSTEKNSLTLQLERLEQQYKDVAKPALRGTTAVVNVSDEEEVLRQRLPAFMRESPTDTEVTKKMKQAAKSIDRFSIKLGVFFRRYPVARLFIVFYMALLHLWVMIVLLTYQPEMHGADVGQPQPPQK